MLNNSRVRPPSLGTITHRLQLGGGGGDLPRRCPRFQRLSGGRKLGGSVSVKQGQGRETTFSTQDGGINKAARELGEPQTPRGLVGNLRI